MARNIEIKARVADLKGCRAAARRLADDEVGRLHQVDTYLHCRCGRLKLREMEATAELIWYRRADRKTAKASDYLIAPVHQPEMLKAVLSAALGIWRVVDKRREVLLYENVRIHLDEVAGLGTFVEFEAVIRSDADERAAPGQFAYLRQRLGLSDEALIEGSYSDLVAGS